MMEEDEIVIIIILTFFIVHEKSKNSNFCSSLCKQALKKIFEYKMEYFCPDHLPRAEVPPQTLSLSWDVLFLPSSLTWT